MKILKLALALMLTAALLYKCGKDGSAETFSGTGLSGSTARFALNGNHLYTVDNSTLHVFSLANGAKPVKGTDVAVGNDIETIYSLNSNLFIGSSQGVYFMDVSNPDLPVLSNVVSHFRACDPVVADNQFAFVTLSSSRVNCSTGANQLIVYNIANIYEPYIVSFKNLSNPKGLALDGKWLFVCDQNITMFDRSTISNLVVHKKTATLAANDCIAGNNLLTVSADDGIYQYDYANGNLNFLSKIAKVQPL